MLDCDLYDILSLQDAETGVPAPYETSQYAKQNWPKVATVTLYITSFLKCPGLIPSLSHFLHIILVEQSLILLSCYITVYQRLHLHMYGYVIQVLLTMCR